MNRYSLGTVQPSCNLFYYPSKSKEFLKIHFYCLNENYAYMLAPNAELLSHLGMIFYRIFLGLSCDVPILEKGLRGQAEQKNEENYIRGRPHADSVLGRLHADSVRGRPHADSVRADRMPIQSVADRMPIQSVADRMPIQSWQNACRFSPWQTACRFSP
jgi:hypothetical protein